jgi:uncharacterized protein (TIGR02001 family)
MRKTIIAASLASAVFAVPQLANAQAAAPAAAAAPASPHTFTGNMSLVSDYRFRGISQTFKQPAIQGGFDYSHTSGFYVGNWDSNVNSGAGYPGGSIEMDFYGGWKQTWGDWGLDLGTIYYYYPGTDATLTNFPNPNPRNATKTHTGNVHNWEVYIGGSWKWISAKYYYAVSDYFSLPDTNGSRYFDLSANYDLGDGWNILGHIGSFKLDNWKTNARNTNADYTDWKIGVTKDLSGWVLGAAYVDTNAKGSCATDAASLTQFYCFGNSAAGATKTKDASSGTLVLSVSKSF